MPQSFEGLNPQRYVHLYNLSGAPVASYPIAGRTPERIKSAVNLTGFNPSLFQSYMMLDDAEYPYEPDETFEVGSFSWGPLAGVYCFSTLPDGPAVSCHDAVLMWQKTSIGIPAAELTIDAEG